MHADSGQIVESFEFDDFEISAMQNQKKEIRHITCTCDLYRYRP